MEKVTVGRIVHFITAGGDHRPAVIVQVWPNEYGNEEVKDGINVQVFLDGANDSHSDPSRPGNRYPGATQAEERIKGTAWRTSVKYAAPERNEPGTWHWPERE